MAFNSDLMEILLSRRHHKHQTVRTLGGRHWRISRPGIAAGLNYIAPSAIHKTAPLKSLRYIFQLINFFVNPHLNFFQSLFHPTPPPPSVFQWRLPCNLCVCVCVCMYVCVSVYAQEKLQEELQKCRADYVCVCVYVHLSLCVCVYACVYVCVSLHVVMGMAAEMDASHKGEVCTLLLQRLVFDFRGGHVKIGDMRVCLCAWLCVCACVYVCMQRSYEKSSGKHVEYVCTCVYVCVGVYACVFVCIL